MAEGLGSGSWGLFVMGLEASGCNGKQDSRALSAASECKLVCQPRSGLASSCKGRAQMQEG